MTDKFQNVIDQMSLEEKASLCSGQDAWHTKGVEHLGVPAIMMTDGPHGLRKEAGNSGEPGMQPSVPATCFPPAVLTSCSFDRDLMHEIGVAIGEECKQERVSVILGPGANIKRSPLCGRNFEYFSEDPLVAGEISAALVEGIQSQGIGTCMKHYACNNQETSRMINDSIVDERALREIYLPAFEIGIKKAKPWTLMCAYNKVNGTYACEHQELMTDIPRDEWGFDGAIMTDWGAMDERVWSIKSGLDLEMPYAGPHNDQLIVEAVKSGKLDMATLDRTVRRMLELAEKGKVNLVDNFKYDIEKHDAVARKAASESAVLLKNDGILPLKQGISLAVVGEFAQKPRYQGAGSSRINPHKITSAINELDSNGIAHTYSRGYDLKGKEDAESLIAQAIETAKGKDVVLIFAGLPDAYESEGFDRTNIDMPREHNALIERVAEQNPNVVVVLHEGSAVSMPWLDKVRGVLYMGLGGQCVGAAAVDLLFGKVNPSGKLTETYPLKLSDAPSSKQFGQRLVTQYRESIFVGYRYYDKANKAVLFPFGHGLSYTQFAYSDLQTSQSQISDQDTLTVKVKVRNVGERFGKEIVQLYVAPPQSAIFKAQKELRHFAKVALEPGEEKEVSFVLGMRAFAYWNVLIHDWHVESGTYEVLVGSSSADIRLKAKVDVRSTAGDVTVPSYREKAPVYYALPQGNLDVPLEQFEEVYGNKINIPCEVDKAPLTMNSTIYDARHTKVGKWLMASTKKNLQKMVGGDTDDGNMRMMEAVLIDLPFRSFGMMGMPPKIIEGLVLIMNKKIFKGLGFVIKGITAQKKARK